MSAHEHEDRAKHIVILGGGFGGVAAALAFEKRLPCSGVKVTLVSRENFITFTPMLHEVAASDLDMTHIVNPVRKLLKRVDFLHAEVCGVDLAKKEVLFAHGGDGHTHALPYDHLVVALGSTTNFFGIPGLAERALTMKTLGDAIDLRNRLIEHLEEADTECAAGLRSPLLTVVVAGGGFAGVETIAGVNDFVRESLRFYPHVPEEAVRMVVVHPGQVLLPELSEKLGTYAGKLLTKRGVEVRLGVRVKALTPNGVLLSDGTEIPARTLVWTAGTSPSALLAGLPCDKERGRLKVDECLRVGGAEDVWALGDCATVPDGKGGFHPPTAQHALRQGTTLARNVLAALRGEPARPFRFATLGQLASLGRRSGVAQILGVNFSGFVAWWLWRTIYLSKLPRFEKKVRVALDWTLDLLFTKDLVQFQTARARVDEHRKEGVKEAA
jgi:NADH dehydrogenase